MSKEEIQKIKTLYDAINKILEFTNDMTSAEDLTSNIMAWDAVKMNLVVIYETDLKIDPEFKKKHNNVEWDQIKDNKPIIESRYLGFNSEEIWKAINGKLPEFKKQIESIL
jgi:uncharacterized protein with HEPN domain